MIDPGLSIDLIQGMIWLSCEVKRELISLCVEGVIDGECLIHQCLCSATFALVWLVSLTSVPCVVHLALGNENTSTCGFRPRWTRQDSVCVRFCVFVCVGAWSCGYVGNGALGQKIHNKVHN